MKKQNKRNTKKNRKKIIKRNPQNKQVRIIKSISFTEDSFKYQLPEIEIPQRGDLDWKKNNRGLNDLNFYHITTPDKVSLIKKKGGIIGNQKENPYHGLSEKGFIYTTVGFRKDVWDKIRYHQCFNTQEDVNDSVLRNRKEKEYVVYKINGSSLLKRGIKLFEDFNDGIINLTGSIKFYIGDEMIPINELENIGTFRTFKKCCHRVDDYGRFLDNNGNILNEPNWVEKKLNQLEMEELKYTN